MAPKGRNNDSHTNGQGKGTFRFRYMDSNKQFEVTADNVSGENLLEGFRHVANAITGRTIATPRLLRNAGGGAPPEVLDEKDEKTVETDVLPFPDQPPADEREEVEEAPSSTARPKKPTQPPRTPNVLSDIDLNSGKLSLKEYVTQKAPSGPFEMYATIAVWYKENHNLEEVNDHRIYTAYRFLDEVPPNDVAAILRQLKFRKWFDKGTTKGGYKINIVGLNKVHANFK